MSGGSKKDAPLAKGVLQPVRARLELRQCFPCLSAQSAGVMACPPAIQLVEGEVEARERGEPVQGAGKGAGQALGHEGQVCQPAAAVALVRDRIAEAREAPIGRGRAQLRARAVRRAALVHHLQAGGATRSFLARHTLVSSSAAAYDIGGCHLWSLVRHNVHRAPSGFGSAQATRVAQQVSNTCPLQRCHRRMTMGQVGFRDRCNINIVAGEWL